MNLDSVCNHLISVKRPHNPVLYNDFNAVKLYERN